MSASLVQVNPDSPCKNTANHNIQIRIDFSAANLNQQRVDLWAEDDTSLYDSTFRFPRDTSRQIKSV